LAKRSGLLTFANRPLNSVIADNLCYKLSKPPDHLDKDFASVLKDTINYCIFLEKAYPGTDPTNKLAITGQLPSFKELSWAHILLTHIKTLDLFRFKETRDRVIKPLVENHLKTLAEFDSTREWGITYKRTLWPMLDNYLYYLEHHRNAEIRIFEEGLSQRFPMLDKYNTFSQKCLQIPISTGVNCTLVGMRTPQYVSDSLQVLRSNHSESLEFISDEWDRMFEYTEGFAIKMEEKYKQLSEQPVPTAPPSVPQTYNAAYAKEVNYGLDIEKQLPPGSSTINLGNDKWTIRPPKSKE